MTKLELIGRMAAAAGIALGAGVVFLAVGRLFSRRLSHEAVGAAEAAA